MIRVRPVLMPADTPDYMADAWVECMARAWQSDEARAAFREAHSGQEETMGAFIAWANVWIWGPMDGEPIDVED